MARTMKDSGVEWIGEIPEEWEIEQLGKLYKARSEKVSDYDYPPLSVTKMGIVPQLENAAKSDNHNDRKKVCIGDFVINSRSDRKMSSGSSNFEGSVSLINTVLYSNCILPEFSNYLLKNSNFAEEFYRWGTGIVADLWSTNYERMKRIPIPYVPLSEQRKIAAILDEKTTHIDSIVSKTKESIEAFKAYKQALITQAVTKGLNSDVKMKDSGIEWIGEIPEHWELTKFKYEIYTRGRLGWKGLTADEYVSEGKMFLATPNIKGAEIDFVNVNYITDERYQESPEIMLSEGDVLLTKDGSTLGTVNVVRFLPGEATVNSSIAVLTPLAKLNSLYLYHYIKSSYIQNVVNRKKDGMGVPHLFQKDIKEFNLLLPELKEQQQIAAFLDEKTAHIDSLIANKEKMVQDLETYKKALIYEYVTGKKEVE